ncbi:MAG: hypothetical protein ACOCYQ_09215 [Alkalispirochaeta sp.]
MIQRMYTLAAVAAMLVVTGIVPVAAQIGGQIVGFAAAPLAEDPDSIDDLPREYRKMNDEELFAGIEGELWFDRFGFGMRHAGTFHRLEVEVFDESVDSVRSSMKDAWWYDGQSDLFASFHLFRGGSGIDPYIRYGVGVSSRTYLNEHFGYDDTREIWTTAEAPQDDEDGDEEAEDSYDRVVSAGLYQYFGAGVQVNLSGLVIGTGVNYNILHQQFETVDETWGSFPKARFEARVYGGVAF